MPRARKRATRKQASASLESYREKRDFQRTPEPGPDTDVPTEGPLTFVIQKHKASRLHYDFRLEVDGTLKSWSVPKGPSLDTKDKRMAVMVEDHPMDYGSFEGVIPKGEYGAGQVIVWDNGTYSPDEGGELSFHDRKVANARMRSELAEGKVSIQLRGKKLKGSWTLVKMQRGENDWLLIKHRDEAVDTERDVTEEDRSVSSGLTIEDIKAGHLPDRSQRGAPPSPALLPGVRAAKALPKRPAPMFATPAEAAFSDRNWLFEPKLDGVRVIGLMRDGKVTLLSRSGLDATEQYPLVAEELAKQPVHDAVFDGEVVALDDEGRPSFELLQQRLNLKGGREIARAESDVPVFFYAFDLLHLDGYDLRSVALRYRRPMLESVLAPTNIVRLVDDLGHEGEVAYQGAKEFGLEGVIAKRLDSTYEAGQRSKSWLKIKTTQSDEFVVGGFTPGQGGRKSTFGALVIGQYDDDGKLVYSGNVGSGFDDPTLDALRARLDKIRRKRSPFAERPELKPEPAWVRPEVVVEVKFAHWTKEGRLRAPVFLRVRDEKTASQVQRVEVVPTPELGDDSDGSIEDEVASVLEQLEAKKQRMQLAVDGETVALTNLDKELWPKHGRRRALTKRDFLVYLAKVAPYMLPHLRDRPLTLTRYPNGIDGKHFYQKHWEHELPEFVDTVELYSSSNEGDQEYLICNNLATLLWLGQLANLEFHTWYSRVNPEPDGAHLSTKFTGSKKHIESSLLNHPDFVVFDFDPYIYSGKEKEGDEPELNRKAFRKTCEAALWLKEILDELSLSSFVKTTGKTGLHVYVPITRRLDYTSVRAACETIGKFLLQQHPKDVTMEWSVDKRTGKIFFDHNQNMRGKTLASIYSVRPVAEAGVSMPLRWDEVGEIYPTDFTMLTAPDRLAEVGDLWRDILDAKHDLEGLLAAAGS